MRFQSDAATIQMRLTDAFLLEQQTFDRARQERDWSADSVQRTVRLGQYYRSLVEAWERLAPPEALREDWESLARALRGLEPLWERAARLPSGTGPSLLPTIAGLQQEFTRGIEKLNSIERSLLDKETELSQG